MWRTSLETCPAFLQLTAWKMLSRRLENSGVWQVCWLVRTSEKTEESFCVERKSCSHHAATTPMTENLVQITLWALNVTLGKFSGVVGVPFDQVVLSTLAVGSRTWIRNWWEATRRWCKCDAFCFVLRTAQSTFFYFLQVGCKLDFVFKVCLCLSLHLCSCAEQTVYGSDSTQVSTLQRAANELAVWVCLLSSVWTGVRQRHCLTFVYKFVLITKILRADKSELAHWPTA